MISRQEHEAWDVLLACQGQLRMASSGHVVGIDMATALSLASARGFDLAVLSELLPAAEAGLVEALCSDADRSHRSLNSATNVRFSSTAVIAKTGAFPNPAPFRTLAAQGSRVLTP